MVNDYANVIDDASEQRIEQTLRRLQSSTIPSIQIAVVTVQTTEGRDIFDYSLAVARGWGIGSKENDNPGALLFVAVNDRKYFTQISRDLEGDLTDGEAGQIQRERLVPAFRQGNYGGGIEDTVNAYITNIAQSRGFDAANIIGQAQQPPPVRERTRPTQRRGQPAQSSLGVCCIVLVVLFFILFMISGRGGRGGGGGGGLLSSLLWGMFLSNAMRGGGGGGWSGGGFGGSDGGGGGWGGFGGGGDFGGGGAGGDW